MAVIMLEFYGEQKQHFGKKLNVHPKINFSHCIVFLNEP